MLSARPLPTVRRGTADEASEMVVGAYGGIYRAR
jgi:hypothetical protein